MLLVLMHSCENLMHYILTTIFESINIIRYKNRGSLKVGGGREGGREGERREERGRGGRERERREGRGKGGREEGGKGERGEGGREEGGREEGGKGEGREGERREGRGKGGREEGGREGGRWGRGEERKEIIPASGETGSGACWCRLSGWRARYCTIPGSLLPQCSW